MSAVDLSAIPTIRVEPRAIDAGRIQRGALQAPAQRIDRLGNRNAIVITTALMSEEPDGRRWRALLRRARRDGAIFEWPQLDFRVGAPGAPRVAAPTLVGRVLSLTGLTPNYTIRLGQAMSVVADGRRFLHFADGEVHADDAGAVTVRLDDLIRHPIPDGSVVEIGKPKIEGSIEGDIGGPYDLERATSFSFTLTEDE